MKTIKSIASTLFLLLVFTASIFGQKNIRIVDGANIIMKTEKTPREDDINNTLKKKSEVELIQEFQKNLKVFLKTYPDIKDYSFTYIPGREMNVEKSTIAKIYALKDGVIEDIGRNTAVIRYRDQKITMYFDDVSQLLESKWIEYLGKARKEKKSWVSRLIKDNSVVQYDVTLDKREVISNKQHTVFIDADGLPIKILGKYYGTGANFRFGYQNSSSILGINTVYAGLELDVYIGKLLKPGIMGTIGIGSDKFDIFFGIPFSNKKGAAYEGSSYMFGTSFKRDWGILSPRLFLDKNHKINNLGAQFTFLF